MSLLLLFNNPDLYGARDTITIPKPLDTEDGADASSTIGRREVPVDAAIRGGFRWNSKEKELRKYFEDN